jgi:SPW repeat
MHKTWKNESLTDVVNLALGAWLFLSPWIWGFAPQAAVSWNAWISGVVVAGLAVAALAAFAEWQEWLNLIVGIWVAISPWVVGFSANAAATQDHLVVGVIVAVVAAVRLWFLRQGPPRVTV